METHETHEEMPNRFQIRKLEERIAPSATVVDVGADADGGRDELAAHAVLTPSGNVNASGHA